jgi:DNA recombination protein RmuC
MKNLWIWLPEISLFAAGFAAGAVASWVFWIIRSKTARELADEIYKAGESQRRMSLDAFVSEVKAGFGDLSLKALGRSTEEFLKLAASRLGAEREVSSLELEEKKGAIDRQLARMLDEIEKVARLVRELEKDRVEKFGDLTRQLQSTREQTEALEKTTGNLRRALASPIARGQWGERMAEDVLRIAGFVENVNYLKQAAVEGVGTRPDFTFLLPKGLKLNMDVKFPLDNYMRYLDAGSDAERERYRSDFQRDVRRRMKEVSSREYIDPEQRTLGFVLVFIPNERIYAFMHENDASLLDTGIRKKVVLCSPLTLFAVLAVIRQAVDNFSLEQTSAEILSLLGAFQDRWEAFLGKLDLLGKRIGEAQKEFDALSTTRRRQLERPLNRIRELRAERGAAPWVEPGGEGGQAPEPE